MTKTKSDQRSLIADLLDAHGETYAAQAKIALADKPSPLYQLLVLANLLSARISADVAVAAARELFRAGYRTPEKMSAATWQHRVDALGRGHYKRYDERTATMLGDGADLLIERWGGDLRRLRDEAGGDVRRIRDLLTAFPGIGATGADIFLREVQIVWPQVAPYVDERVRQETKSVGLPSTGRALSGLVGSTAELVRLESALMRARS